MDAGGQTQILNVGTQTGNEVVAQPRLLGIIKQKKRLSDRATHRPKSGDGSCATDGGLDRIPIAQQCHAILHTGAPFIQHRLVCLGDLHLVKPRAEVLPQRFHDLELFFDG